MGVVGDKWQKELYTCERFVKAILKWALDIRFWGANVPRNKKEIQKINNGNTGGRRETARHYLLLCCTLFGMELDRFPILSCHVLWRNFKGLVKKRDDEKRNVLDDK